MLLAVYRKVNSMMAMWRDDCKCPMCGAVADESDHVFGRGHSLDMLLEHWILRMSLCKRCHHEKHHSSEFGRLEQVRRLKSANDAFFASEEMENCCLAINEGLLDITISDLDRAFDFIDDWLVKNG